MEIEWQDRYNFLFIEDSDIKLKGYIDKERITKFNKALFEKIKTELQLIESDRINGKEIYYLTQKRSNEEKLQKNYRIHA